MNNTKWFNLYMKFTKRAVFGFFLVLGLGYTDRAFFHMGFNLAELETVGLLILSTVVFMYVKIAVSFYAKYDALYDLIQNKVCDFIADYVLNIHNH